MLDKLNNILNSH